MREILFRGITNDGELLEGFYLKSGLSGIPFIGAPNSYGTMLWRAVNPETVGQFTGLTDKNGKRIFDGDIIKDDWGKIFKVIFTTASCGFMVECTVAPNEYEKGKYRLGDAWCNTIAVVGNIHQTPELMHGAK